MNLVLKNILVVVCLISLASCSLYEFPDPTPEDYAVHGIDVSRWQGDIDWRAVRKDGIAFAWIKATEGGDHIDPRFLDNWYAAKAAGVPRGAYHFYYFCRPVEEQIAWVQENIPVDSTALPLVLDMEWNAHSKTCRERPDHYRVNRDMKAFLDAMEAHYGKRPVVYSSVDFHRDRLVGAFKGEQFWLRSVAAYPNRVYKHRDEWYFWQYTAEGTVDGIDGKVDRNVFYGAKSQFEDWLKGELER